MFLFYSLYILYMALYEWYPVPLRFTHDEMFELGPLIQPIKYIQIMMLIALSVPIFER